MFQNQQKYEKAAKEAEAASQAFARVNEDMNATKAQVEKVCQISHPSHVIFLPLS